MNSSVKNKYKRFFIYNLRSKQIVLEAYSAINKPVYNSTKPHV